MAEHIKSLIKDYIKENKKKVTQIEKIEKNIKNKIKGGKIYFKIKEKKENQVILVTNSSSAAYQLKLQENKIKKEIKKEIPQTEKIKIEIE